MTFFPHEDARCLELAEVHGTPSFHYDLATVRAQYRRLHAALPGRARIAYAVKANPHAAILQALAEEGASFDCASGGELARVAQLPLGPGQVFYAGPGKGTWELDLALAQGARIQAEGWEDLARLEALAEARSLREVAVNLRVHPARGVEEDTPILGGTGPSAFGVDEEDLPALLAQVATLRRVQIRGLHCFAASNQRDALRLLATHAMVLELARELHVAHGLELTQVDVGGGLGLAYGEGESDLDVEALGRGLGDLLGQHGWFRGELILEPGRFLAGPCGTYLVRVRRVKESRGTRFVILEGGANHLLRPLLTGQAFPVRAVGRDGEALRPATLAGPLCTSLDRLGEVCLPELAPGDLLAVGRVGAYGFTEAMTHFLSHPVPAEVGG